MVMDRPLSGEQQPILAITRWLRHSGNMRAPGQRRGQADRPDPGCVHGARHGGPERAAAGLNWWATLRDALPDGDGLATAVAEELDEPLEDVRPSVMTATLVRRVDASLDDLKAVVDGERERARVRECPPPAAAASAGSARRPSRISWPRRAGSRMQARSTCPRPLRSSARLVGSRRARGRAWCCSSPGSPSSAASSGTAASTSSGPAGWMPKPWARWAAGSSCGPRSPRSWSRTATGRPSARSSPVTPRPAAAPWRSSWASSPRTR